MKTGSGREIAQLYCLYNLMRVVTYFLFKCEEHFNICNCLKRSSWMCNLKNLNIFSIFREDKEDQQLNEMMQTLGEYLKCPCL